MKLRLINLLLLALLLTTIGCSEDDVVAENKGIRVQDLALNIDENPTNGQIIGTVETDGSGTLSFSIASQTPNGALNVDSSTGELTVADATLFDFETNPIITASISVVGAANTGTVTINLNNLNEISVQNLVVTIDENPTNGQVIGTVQAEGSGPFNFSVSAQIPTGALNIDVSTGELTVADATLFDFEMNPTITATISITGAANTGMVTIDLNDLNEISIQDLEVTIDENPTNGQVVGTVQVDGSGPFSFSIGSQSPVGALDINTSTGELTVANATLFDFETNPVITATISVVGALNTGSVTVNLNDLDEAATVGDFRDGGVVFWVDPTDNTHGLVCAVSDQSTGIQWFNGANIVTGAIATSIGTGQANTTAITSAQGDGAYAAQICNDLSLNGYDDWFLPSVDELQEIYSNKATINATALANSGTSLGGVVNYWSSTENSSSGASYLNIFDGAVVPNGFKGSGLSVRAVRAF